MNSPIANAVLVAIIILTTGHFSWCQNSVSGTVSIKKIENKESGSNELLTNHSTNSGSSEDEGTNNPESTGATKLVKNGRTVYIKYGENIIIEQTEKDE